MADAAADQQGGFDHGPWYYEVVAHAAQQRMRPDHRSRKVSSRKQGERIIAWDWDDTKRWRKVKTPTPDRTVEESWILVEHEVLGRFLEDAGPAPRTDPEVILIEGCVANMPKEDPAMANGMSVERMMSMHRQLEETLKSLGHVKAHGPHPSSRLTDVSDTVSEAGLSDAGISVISAAGTRPSTGTSLPSRPRATRTRGSRFAKYARDNLGEEADTILGAVPRGAMPGGEAETIDVGFGPGVPAPKRSEISQLYEVVFKPRVPIRKHPRTDAPFIRSAEAGDFVDLYEWDPTRRWRRCKTKRAVGAEEESEDPNNPMPNVEEADGWMLICHDTIGTLLEAVREDEDEDEEDPPPYGYGWASWSSTTGAYFEPADEYQDAQDEPGYNDEAQTDFHDYQQEAPRVRVTSTRIDRYIDVNSDDEERVAEPQQTEQQRMEERLKGMTNKEKLELLADEYWTKDFIRTSWNKGGVSSWKPAKPEVAYLAQERNKEWNVDALKKRKELREKVLKSPEAGDANLGEPDIMRAARAGSYEVVKDLLSYDFVDPNETDSEGETALFEAATRGFTNIVGLLLLWHADPDHTSARGTTAEQVCWDPNARTLLQKWRLDVTQTQENEIYEPSNKDVCKALQQCHLQDRTLIREKIIMHNLTGPEIDRLIEDGPEDHPESPPAAPTPSNVRDSKAFIRHLPGMQGSPVSGIASDVFTPQSQGSAATVKSPAAPMPSPASASSSPWAQIGELGGSTPSSRAAASPATLVSESDSLAKSMSSQEPRPPAPIKAPVEISTPGRKDALDELVQIKAAPTSLQPPKPTRSSTQKYRVIYKSVAVRNEPNKSSALLKIRKLGDEVELYDWDVTGLWRKTKLTITKEPAEGEKAEPVTQEIEGWMLTHDQRNGDLVKEINDQEDDDEITAG